ncbi:PREDICTED: EF-hand domain-containing family member C2-like isoform X3 [Vollenhovia emeryi]|uniref:EF-hand domain-containing family member C2-like isoform X3 n=1 Tax=Vollenhovia emeryi TaxID=411798 RepID=UPI0005F52CB7|nr:PREDICTED: EF-hand domain-containing family member C2-like isoform X3 [Vollenhovia emeryi]
MQRAPTLPCLPGFSVDRNLGRTRFHKSQHFDKIHDGVYYLVEKADTRAYSRYSTLYPRGEEPEIPPWLAYDGQRLMFKAFFQETVQEKWKTAFHVRVVNISFFLEDGTMKIVEPSVDNSGLEQGVLVRRQRIPIPDPVKYRYYDVLDLNIGKEPEIYGRVYKIVDCDKFTRHFLNRMGIPVPDPIDIPKDPYREVREVETFPKKPNRTVDTLGNFLKYDRQVLRFYGYWDDTESPHGVVHDLELHYYLSDNTIEIKENVPPNAGRDSGPMLVKRMKIPKFYIGLQPIGAEHRFTVLNVLGESARQSYYMVDSLGTGDISTDYYKDNELGIGAEINVFGRRIVVTDMDAFTKEYYRTKYGLDDFAPLRRPRKGDEMYQKIDRYIPPYNGFGSYEDSLGNCFTVMPKPPKTDFIKFLYHDKQGFNSHVLRFRAKIISKVPENEERQFIIRVFLMDDTISIFELAKRNSGFQRSLFQKRMQIMLPGQDIFTSKKPEYYKSHDFYVGARLNLHDFHFEITSADVYALRYMELHCDKFPKANKNLIMEKLGENLQPVYKEFVQLYAPPGDAMDEARILEYEKLRYVKNHLCPPIRDSFAFPTFQNYIFREALQRYMRDKITEHEMITIARYYSSREKIEHRSREYVRCLLHTELHRLLWHDLDRLKETLHHWDEDRTGFLPRESLYTILRGCRIPVDVELLNSMLDHLRKADDGRIDYEDLLRFVNVKIEPLPPAAPVNVKTALWWASEREPDCGGGINWREFIKDLNIMTEEDAVDAVEAAENGGNAEAEPGR